MQTSNDKQDFKTDDPLWVLLAELPLGDFLSVHDPGDGHEAGLLVQMVRELGMPLECVEKIAMLVTEFAEESLVHYRSQELEFPGRIRIFWQKNIVDDGNAACPRSRADRTEQAMERSSMILNFGTKMNGGWGCFLIKRGGTVSDGASLSSHPFIDLYLYREG